MDRNKANFGVLYGQKNPYINRLNDIKKCPYKTVFKDVVMPEVIDSAISEGIAAGSGPSELKFVLPLSSGQKGDAASCREPGANAYLAKPLMSAQYDAINTTLGASSKIKDQASLDTTHPFHDERRHLHILSGGGDSGGRT
jgi:CheY-like chemotaxis protein